MLFYIFFHHGSYVITAYIFITNNNNNNNNNNTKNIVKSLQDLIRERGNVVWTSPLSDYNKIVATNILVMSCVEYFM